MKKHRSMLAAAIAVPVAGLLLAGCSSTGETPQAEEAAINVVATTNVYGQIARVIGGDNVEVSEIITSTAQDPHSYEPTARDKLSVSKARVVLANGGGYDPFVDSLVSSLPEAQAENVTLIHAVDSSPVAEEFEKDAHEGESAEEHAAHADDEHAGHEGHDHAEYNEHIWYDLASMSSLAGVLAQSFGEADSQNADLYKQNAATFTEGIAKLETQLAEANLKGKKFMMTEPVPFHLLTDAGMNDITPDRLSESIEEGEGIAPLTMNQALGMLSTGLPDVLAYNVQTEGSETKALKESAVTGKVPVVDFAETIQDDSSYLEWMESNISQLASTING